MKHNQNGAINVLLIPFILVVLLLFAAIGFGAWSYSSRQDYKYNVDQKISAAVELAKQQESTDKDKQFAEAEKKPLKTYSGPQASGSLVIKYPKTWSSYVDDTTVGGIPVDGYFYPGTVPSITATSSTFALRVQVLAQAYSDILSSLSGQQQNGALTIDAYKLPSVPGVVGVIVNGQIEPNKTVSMVILPLRDKTIEISTQGDQFKSDFTANILPNLSFSP
jgi:multidrug efflux pump subunit AcrA (membrane-fusion protein)